MERVLLRVARGWTCMSVSGTAGTADLDTGASVVLKCAEGTGSAGLPQEAGWGATASRPGPQDLLVRAQLLLPRASHASPATSFNA